MLDDHYRCKLCDFGMARLVPNSSIARRMTLCGTNEYMAPEILFDEEYTLSVDIFSFGMVLFEVNSRWSKFIVQFDCFVCWFLLNTFFICVFFFADLEKRSNRTQWIFDEKTPRKVFPSYIYSISPSFY